MKQLTIKPTPETAQQLKTLQVELKRHGYAASLSLLYFVWIKISEDYSSSSWQTITGSVAKAWREAVLAEFAEEV